MITLSWIARPREKRFVCSNEIVPLLLGAMDPIERVERSGITGIERERAGVEIDCAVVLLELLLEDFADGRVSRRTLHRLREAVGFYEFEGHQVRP